MAGGRRAPSRGRTSRWARFTAFLGRHKALTVLFSLVLVLFLAVGGWTFYLNQQLGDVARFEVETTLPEEPPRVPGDALNILLIGADGAYGTDQSDNGVSLKQELADGQWTPGVYRSDTLMVLHLDPDRKHGQIISIPRDSWVDIPGHGKNKINAAFSLGGPSLARDTVEQLTGLYIDNVAVIDFAGFIRMSEIIGGVDLYVPETVVDTVRDVTWTKGWHHLEGENALLYVRQRYGLPNGDFDRIQRQQLFLREMFRKTKTTGVLANPAHVTDLAEDLAQVVAVDDGMTNGRLRSLIFAALKLDPDNLDLLTAPVKGTGTVGTASVVFLDDPTLHSLFDAVAHSDFKEWYADHEADMLPDDAQSVD